MKLPHDAVEPNGNVRTQITEQSNWLTGAIELGVPPPGRRAADGAVPRRRLYTQLMRLRRRTNPGPRSTLADRFAPL